MDQSNQAYLGAAILIGLLVFSNLIVYGIARGAARGNKGPTFMKDVGDMFRNSSQKGNDPMDELRRKVEELQDKGNRGDSAR
jgi:hypothetical protein